jgi:PAS domain S-box-containing protein
MVDCMQEEKDTDSSKSLRQQAQERLQAIAKPVLNDPEQVVRVVEELHIHQIELEIQNENLRTAQQQLMESRENYRDLFEFAPVPYLTIDEQNRIIEANHAASKLLNATHNVLIDHSITRYIEEQSLSAFYACCNHANSLQKSHSCELLIRQNGIPLTVLLTIVAFKTVNSGTIFRLMLDDITVQKENERLLARSKEYVSSIVETIKDPLVVLTGSEFIIDSVNGAFYTMFATTSKETIGKKLDMFKDGLLNDGRLFLGLENILREGNDFVGFIFEGYLPYSGLRQLQLGARRIGTTDIMREKLLLVIEDITERKASENKIRELNESLKQRAEELLYSNKEMESFIYSVSHDLRAPLRAVSGFTEILKDDYASALDETGKDYLMRVLRGTEKMSQLIDDLLRLSKISRHELQFGSVDLSAIVTDIFNILQTGNPNRKADVTIQKGIEVQADSRLLRIAIENLFQNAWKYTSKCEHPIIEFGITESQGKKVCYIRDNGVGFDQKYATKIFNPFQRLHSENDFPGTGIGLAIVKRIIEKHGGSIWATGEKGKGATIYFSLPG